MSTTSRRQSPRDSTTRSWPCATSPVFSDQDFAGFLRKHDAVGLKTPTALVFLPDDLKVVGPDVDDPRLMAYVRTAFARARQLGIELIVSGSGPARRVPAGFPKEEAFGQLVEFSKRIAPLAGSNGIVLGVEAQRREETNGRVFPSSFDEYDYDERSPAPSRRGSVSVGRRAGADVGSRGPF